MEWDGGACEDRKGLFEEMIFELKLKGRKKPSTHMVQGRRWQAKGLEDTASAGHLAPAAREDVVVTEEVTHWAGEDGEKEKEVGRKGVNQG